MSTAIQTSSETVVIDGRHRAVQVVSPTTAPTAPPPLVLLFHGSNQTARTLGSSTGRLFDRLATEHGALVAYLDGYKKHWNDARRSTTFAARTDGVDDVAYTEAAIDILIKRHGADPDRVYLIGYSNGGQMVIRLLHEIPARLAGAVVISATQPDPENFAPAAEQARALPVILVHGTKDPLVPYAGGMASLWGFRPRGLGLSAPETAAYYARRNGITNAPHSTEPSVDERTRVERTEYRQAGRPPVTLITIHGGGHTIPGPKKAPFITGRTNQSLDLVQTIGSFFALG
jgi:polyhydroxybutyrate depolymerase